MPESHRELDIAVLERLPGMSMTHEAAEKLAIQAERGDMIAVFALHMAYAAEEERVRNA